VKDYNLLPYNKKEHMGSINIPHLFLLLGIYVV